MKSHLLYAAAVISALILVLGFCPAATGESAELVGRWDFDDGSGRDLSGRGNHAVLGGAHVHPLGNGRACLMFLPDADPMRIPASEDSPLAISRGTICFWLNAGWNRTTILQYDNRAIQLNDYRGDFQVRFEGQDDFRYWDLTLDYDWPKYDMREWAFYGHPRAAIGDSQWHLFAVAYDDRNKHITGWRDGELIATVDLSTVKMEPLKRDGLTEIVTGDDFMGFLDDLRIYDRVLSTAEIRGIFESTQSVYANRRDTIPHDRVSVTYKYLEKDRTLYRAWLQYDPPAMLKEQLGSVAGPTRSVLRTTAPDAGSIKANPRTEAGSEDFLRHIVAEGANSTVQTAASELSTAVQSMFGFEPSDETKPEAASKVVLGTAETSTWIRRRADELGLDRIKDDGFIIKTVDDGSGKALVVAGNVPAGVVFGVFDLIRRTHLGQDLQEIDVLENPQIPIRLVDHWSYFRGFPHDAWRGGGRDNSIYSWEELRTGDTKLIRDWVRMMASAGWNAICPSEVNWHYRDNFLEHLDEVEVLAGILRDYGMKLYWSPSYLLALEQETANALYARVPDFGGYVMKLGSEKQNGDPRPPMVNRIADTLKPHGGTAVVRAFVYGNYRYTPEPYRNLIPYDLFAHEDGNFRENVIVTPKGSPMDWDLSAPIPALDGAIQKNLSGSELVIDKGWPISWIEKWKWWLQQDNYRSGPGSLNKFDVDCIMGVSMIEPSPAWTECPLNMVNYYGLGRLAWNPDLTVDEIYTEWIRQTFGNDLETLDTIKTILLMLDDVSRKLYNYRGYRGVWIDTGDDGMVESKTPYTINRDGIGVRTATLGQRLLAQYAPGLRQVYGDPLRGEEFLTAIHFAKHDQRLSIGRTLIQDVYGNMEEAVGMADQVVRLWRTLEDKIDQHRYRYTLDSLAGFAAEAREGRDKMAAGFEAFTGRTREKVLSGLTAAALSEAGTFNVRHFGALADGKANDASAINKAVAACSAAGGGTVFVPSGVYATSSIRLKSRVTLALDAGAVLKPLSGAMVPRESRPNDQSLMDPSDNHRAASLIWGKNLENVKIYGPGAIDGTTLARSGRLPRGTGDKGIALEFCRNVEIRNLNVRQGGQYAIFATGCEDVVVDNVNITTDRGGLYLSQCRNVMVSNCHIDAVRREGGRPAGGGNAIILGSDLSLDESRPSENITIRNCFLESGSGALQLGADTIGAYRNIRCENIRIFRPGKAGISASSNDGD